MNYRPVVVAGSQAAALMLAGLIVPLLGQIALLLAPVPLITAGVLHGRATGAAATLLAAALLSLAGSWHTTLLFLLGFGVMALAIADGMHRDLRPETVVALGGALPLVALAAVLMPLLLQAGKSPAAIVEEYLRTGIADAQKIYTDLGITDVAQMLASLADRIVHYAVRLMPGIVLATTLLQAAGCYGLARALIARRRPDLPPASQPPLAHWHAPDTWVWGLIASLVLVALPDQTAFFTGLNILLTFVLVYTTQGVAVLDFYFRKVRIPVVMRGLLHAMVLALPTVVAVVSLGVVDIWADFRKLRSPGQST